MDDEAIILVGAALIVIIVIGALIMRSYVSKKRITVKHITFVGIMSAMGTALALATFAPIGPNINIDFSHIGTFITALVLGPFYGMIAGALIGFYPMIIFGNPLVPVGKAMTGLFIGLLITRARLVIGVERGETMRLLQIVPTTLVGWIPEALFTLVTLGILGIPVLFPMPLVEGILVKGVGEIILLGVLCEFLFASKALRHRLASVAGEPT